MTQAEVIVSLAEKMERARRGLMAEDYAEAWNALYISHEEARVIGKMKEATGERGTHVA